MWEGILSVQWHLRVIELLILSLNERQMEIGGGRGANKTNVRKLSLNFAVVVDCL